MQSGGSPYCQLCMNTTDSSNETNIETIEHLISICSGMAQTRNNILNSMKKVCRESGVNIHIDSLSNTELTQFILDPSSLNLKKRVNINHPILPTLFQLSRDFCYKIDRDRLKKLK